MINQNYKTLTILLAVALILACAPVLVPSAPPTLDPISLNTAIAQTSGAALTQNAANQPSTPTLTFTPLPTKTPTEIPSPTPTFIFILATNTVPSPTKTQAPTAAPASGGGDCRVISQDPANNTTFSPGKNFDASWLVKNNGTNTWDENSADYRYASGDKIQRQDIYDLPVSVAPGDRVEIIVEMKAPNNSGTYTTTWQIRQGKNIVCSMSLTIIVS